MVEILFSKNESYCKNRKLNFENNERLENE